MNVRMVVSTAVVVLFFICCLLSGCATRRVPMANFPDLPYNLLTPQNMAQQLPVVFRRVREREPSTSWSVVSQSSEAVGVQCNWRQKMFVVEIVLKESGYNVRYVSSKNLQADSGSGDGKIYYAYNKLLSYLMEEINDLNHGNYTDVRLKARRNTFWGSDYMREDRPQNVVDVALGNQDRAARAKRAARENVELEKSSRTSGRINVDQPQKVASKEDLLKALRGDEK